MSDGMDAIAAMTGVGNILGQGVNLFQVLDNMYRFNQRNKEPMFADIMDYQVGRFNQQPYGPYSNPQDSFGGIFGSGANGQPTQYGDWAAQQLMGMFQNNPANYSMNQLGNAAAMQRPQTPSFASMYGSGGGYQPGSYAMPYANNIYSPGWDVYSNPQSYQNARSNPYSYQPLPGAQQQYPQVQNPQNAFAAGGAKSLQSPAPQNTQFNQAATALGGSGNYGGQSTPQPTTVRQSANYTQQPTGSIRQRAVNGQAYPTSVRGGPAGTQVQRPGQPQPNQQWNNAYQGLTGQQPAQTPGQYQYTGGQVYNRGNANTQGQSQSWGQWQPQWQWPSFSNGMPVPVPYYSGGGRNTGYNANISNLNMPTGMLQEVRGIMDAFTDALGLRGNNQNQGGGTQTQEPQRVPGTFNLYQGPNGRYAWAGAYRQLPPWPGGAYYGGGFLDILANTYGRNPNYGSGQTGMYSPNYGMGGGNYGQFGWPQYKQGTPFVPETGPAILHKGEAVVPAEENPEATPWMQMLNSVGKNDLPRLIKGMPSYQNGTPYVPQTGPALLHRGEAVVPAAQNPAAQQVQRPPTAMTPSTAVPATNPNTNQMRNNLLAQQLQTPQSMGPQVQQQLYKAQADETDKMLQDQTRQIREDASARGMQNAGATDYLVNQARMNRANTLSAALGDIQARAAVQNFADRNSVANMALQHQMGLGSQDIQQQRLALQQELGRGGLGLQQELGRGELGIKRQAQQLAEQLGLGQLGLSGRAQTLSEELGRGGLSLQQELGRGELGLKSQAQTLAEQLGLGQLGVSQAAQALSEQLGLGQLGLGQRAQSLTEELGRGELELKSAAQTLAEQLGYGQLGLGQQELGLKSELGRGQLGLGQQELGLKSELGRGQLGVSQSAQALAERLGLGELALKGQAQQLAEALGLGELGLSQQRFGLETELGRRGQTLQENLGYGQLGISQQAQDLAQMLGIGNLGISQADQAFKERMGMGDAQMQYQQMLQDQFNQDRAFQSQLAQQMFGLGQAGTAQQMGLMGEFANLIGQGEQWNQNKVNDLWSRAMQLYATPDIAPFSYANYPPNYTQYSGGSGGGGSSVWGALGQAAGGFLGGQGFANMIGRGREDG